MRENLFGEGWRIGKTECVSPILRGHPSSVFSRNARIAHAVRIGECRSSDRGPVSRSRC
jgi:hypothetical protein